MPRFQKMEEDISEMKVALNKTTKSDEVFMVEQPTEASYADAIKRNLTSTQVSTFLRQEEQSRISVK